MASERLKNYQKAWEELLSIAAKSQYVEQDRVCVSKIINEYPRLLSTAPDGAGRAPDFVDSIYRKAVHNHELFVHLQSLAETRVSHILKGVMEYEVKHELESLLKLYPSLLITVVELNTCTDSYLYVHAAAKYYLVRLIEHREVVSKDYIKDIGVLVKNYPDIIDSVLSPSYTAKDLALRGEDREVYNELCKLAKSRMIDIISPKPEYSYDELQSLKLLIGQYPQVFVECLKDSDLVSDLDPAISAVSSDAIASHFTWLVKNQANVSADYMEDIHALIKYHPKLLTWKVNKSHAVSEIALKARDHAMYDDLYEMAKARLVEIAVHKLQHSSAVELEVCLLLKSYPKLVIEEIELGPIVKETNMRALFVDAAKVYLFDLISSNELDAIIPVAQIGQLYSEIMNKKIFDKYTPLGLAQHLHNDALSEVLNVALSQAEQSTFCNQEVQTDANEAFGEGTLMDLAGIVEVIHIKDCC